MTSRKKTFLRRAVSIGVLAGGLGLLGRRSSGVARMLSKDLRAARRTQSLARVRTKIATINRRRIVKPSRLEQGVRRPLIALAQRVHRVDIKINRKARKIARKVGIPA